MNQDAAPADRGRRGTGAALGVAALCGALFVLLAALVASRHGVPYPVDRSMHLWSARHRPDAVVTLARTVTATATGPFPYLCAVAAGLLVGRDTRGRLLAAAAALLFLGIAQAARYGVLHLLHRARPDTVDWLTQASGYSFPSGHTSTSALMAGLLAWALFQRTRPILARTGCALMACWAVVVGLSRIYLGVHWPSDVLGGWLYALVWLGVGYALAPAVMRRVVRVSGSAV
ncbi:MULTISPECIES: phosphatase PAP2 family protein [unclassified Streptomyces]|uniref:phosphatase PAP2 family protein n=1 Tax=unclassified Streptomyces TaxID=2593676 RepID=UPI002E360540|nr:MULTISPECIES: phosphatase PAP2 family protein [unclassified Streptomyces]WUC62846.1 phosphatase PAP2 family protein [Streptomyces sp. NBC_00539]